MQATQSCIEALHAIPNFFRNTRNASTQRNETKLLLNQIHVVEVREAV